MNLWNDPHFVENFYFQDWICSWMEESDGGQNDLTEIRTMQPSKRLKNPLSHLGFSFVAQKEKYLLREWIPRERKRPDSNMNDSLKSLER